MTAVQRKAINIWHATVISNSLKTRINIGLTLIPVNFPNNVSTLDTLRTEVYPKV